MALVDQINAVTNAVYLSKLPQLFAGRNILESRQHKRGSKPQGGERIKQHIMYQNTKGDFYREYDKFDTSAEEQLTAAFWDWSFLNIPITLSRADQLRNAGAPAVKSLMDAKMKGAVIRGSQLKAQAFFGTGIDSSKAPNSIDNMLDDAAGTLSGTSIYGTIDRAVGQPGNAFWQGVQLDGSGTAVLDYDLLSSAQALVHDGDISPTIWMMHNQAFHIYMKSQQSFQRYLKQSEMDSGFLTAEFNGRPIIADTFVPFDDAVPATNRIYGINEEFLDMVTHSAENMRFEPFAKPVDQAAIVAHIMWAGGNTSSDPSRHVVIHNWDAS